MLQMYSYSIEVFSNEDSSYDGQFSGLVIAENYKNAVDKLINLYAPSSMRNDIISLKVTKICFQDDMGIIEFNDIPTEKIDGLEAF